MILNFFWYLTWWSFPSDLGWYQYMHIFVSTYLQRTSSLSWNESNILLLPPYRCRHKKVCLFFSLVCFFSFFKALLQWLGWWLLKANFAEFSLKKKTAYRFIKIVSANRHVLLVSVSAQTLFLWSTFFFFILEQTRQYKPADKDKNSAAITAFEQEKKREKRKLK